MGEVQTAERDLAKLARTPARTLRIALECHTCFDWLMPIMDVFRKDWPEVELDLVSGFHPNPIAMLADGKTDLVIGSENKARRGIVHHPLFRFEVLAVLPTDHPLREKRYLSAGDFARENAHHLPGARGSHRLDPEGAETRESHSEAPHDGTDRGDPSTGRQPPRRGGAAELGIKNYLDYKYVIARRIGKNGLEQPVRPQRPGKWRARLSCRTSWRRRDGNASPRLDGVVPVE